MWAAASSVAYLPMAYVPRRCPAGCRNAFAMRLLAVFSRESSSSVALEVEARTDGAGGGAGRGLSVAER